MKLADLSNPVALAKIIAASNANTIPVNATGTSYASQTEGFPAITMIPEEQGGEAPHGLDFNGFLKMLSSHVFNLQNGTPETFNPAVSSAIGGYPKNAQLWLIDDNNSRYLKSTKDDNTDNFLTNPSVIGTSWVDAFPTKNYVDNADTELQTQITTNANNIATKANNNAVVHLAGAETITGSKTFTSPVNSELPLGTYYSVQTKKKGETKGTAPTERLINGISFYDKDEKLMGSVRHAYETNKDSHTSIFAYKANSSDDESYTHLSVVYPADGTTPYAEAPNSDTSGIAKIVTTISKYRDGTGHYKFGNGLIINWGRKTYASPDPQIATFHEQFTSPYYKVVATYYYNGQVSSSRDHITITEQNTNNFKFYMSDTTGYAINWIAIGY